MQISKKRGTGVVNDGRKRVASYVNPRVLCLGVRAFTPLVIIGVRCIMGVPVNLPRGQYTPQFKIADKM